MHPCALIALLAIPTVFDVPSFAPEPGSALRKSFELETELTLVEMSATMGGQPVPQEYLPELEIETSSTRRLVVEDELVGVADGRPTKLVRTYVEIAETLDVSVTLDGEDAGSRAAKGESALEGARVAFEWDADAEDFVAAFADERDDDALLAGLDEDLDFRAFVPPAGWSKGPWSIDAEAIEALFEPGGELSITGVEEEGGAFVERSFDARVEATLAAPRETDGKRLLVIELEGEGTAVSDRPGDLSFVPVVQGTATETRTLRFALEGWIAWDAAAGRAHAVELTLAAQVEQVIAKDPGQSGPEFDTTTSLSGDWTFRAEVEAVE